MIALLFHDIPKEEITNEDIDSGLSKLVYDRRKDPENYLAGLKMSPMVLK
jgi:hypothetical protein